MILWMKDVCVDQCCEGFILKDKREGVGRGLCDAYQVFEVDTPGTRWAASWGWRKVRSEGLSAASHVYLLFLLCVCVCVLKCYIYVIYNHVDFIDDSWVTQLE